MMFRSHEKSYWGSPPMRLRVQRFVVPVLAIVIFALAGLSAQNTPASQPTVSVDSVTASQALHDGIDIRAGSATVRITALRDDILRVRIAADSSLPEDASWAVL